jgi:hypothetical protein
MDVAAHFEKVVAGFARYHKSTLGTGLRNKSRETVAPIIRANAERDKAPKLVELRGRLDELFILSLLTTLRAGAKNVCRSAHPGS